MDLVIQEGRTQIIAVIVALIVTFLASQAISNTLSSDRSTAETIQDGIVLALTIALCYFLYQGYSWARWMMAVLLALGASITIPFAAIAIRRSFVGPASLLIQSAIYLVISWFLLRSPQIEAFLSLSTYRAV